jgi:hypothetical protein
LTSKAGDIGVTMMKAIPVNDFVEPAGTRKIAERRAWATVAVIAKCAADLINSAEAAEIDQPTLRFSADSS